MIKKIVSAVCIFLPSGLSRVLFRLAGHKIGRKSRLPLLSYVFAEQLELGNDVDIRPFVFINVHECRIGSNSIISYGSQITGSKGFYTKDNCFIGPHCIIHCEENISLGFYSGLGARCIIYSHGSFLPVNKGYPAKFSEVVIEDFVWTAIGVLFLPGSHVESNCIINAGVVVGSHIPSGTLLQNDSRQFQKTDLNKILNFSRRDNRYYHKKIINSFLSYLKVDFSVSSDTNKYQCSNGYRFESEPEANRIAMFIPGKDRPVFYDFENYYCDLSSDKIHKEFLPFLRLHFGIILRTNYSGTESTGKQ